MRTPGRGLFETEKWAVRLLFVLLWIYIIIRLFSVFYIHDEIVTKWAYMVSWNPWPYRGYIDANNHFLNSLIGGFLIRLFNSDAIWIVRMGNVVSFPLFFWSIEAIRKFFHRSQHSYYFLISLTCTSMVLEFFGMARGYGLSMAFMTLAMLQMMHLFQSGKAWRLWVAAGAWLLAVFANLTLLPIALFSLLYMSLFVFKKLSKYLLIHIGIALLPFLYLVKYALHLGESGKLYYGGDEGFFSVTVHSFLKPIWLSESPIIVVILVLVSVILFVSLLKSMVQERALFSANVLLSILLFVSIVSILLQHYILGINYPEDRAALFLVLLFFGALSFELDRLNLKGLSYALIALTIGLFLANTNFNRFILFEYEHFDKELITSIEKDTLTTVGTHRNWTMDNELTRNPDIPGYAFQLAPHISDTFQDYIIANLERRPDVITRYNPVYQDDISGLTLFKRKKMLPKKKVAEFRKSIEGRTKYSDLFVEETREPYIMRIHGHLENMSIYKSAYIVFSSNDLKSDANNFYQAIPLVQSFPISSEGRLVFDFAMILPYNGVNQTSKVYFWNRNEEEQNGIITLEVFEVGSEDLQQN